MQFADRDWFLEELPEQVDYSWLLRLINVWVGAEALPFNMGVLVTVDENGLPMSRTVAIREINEHGLLFFTQLGSAKVTQFIVNPNVSFTFMLPTTQRQITFSGRVKPLTESENLKNWESYNQERRFAKMFRDAINGFFDVTWPQIAQSLRGRINDNFQLINPVPSS